MLPGRAPTSLLSLAFADSASSSRTSRARECCPVLGAGSPYPSSLSAGAIRVRLEVDPSPVSPYSIWAGDIKHREAFLMWRAP